MTDHSAPLLIGLTGELGRGKSTFAEILAELLPGSQVVAFADALKDDVHRTLFARTPLAPDRAWIEEHKADIFGPIYQGWGEFFRRQFGADYWIDRLAQTLPHRAIVADVRYPNESQWVKSRGGLLVAVDGPCRRDGDRRSVEHPSETGVAACRSLADLAIPNTGTVADLRVHAEAVARIAVALRELEEVAPCGA